MEIVQECWQFIVGMLAGYTIHIAQVRITRKNNSNTVQSNNVVAGDMAGRDIKK